ncbi:stage V sporulation protein AD [Kyrpidia spormannii]|uniref:Stage V sporulation protein AD (Uptake of pyridine-2,6-dicarboxylic acid) n=1 Tax=Kyrpidia spormannii TaxID=2055160 RepID=A0A6F9E8Z5_9BACL|nr:stage V sporulation protein AD [Kyrpidia spormannii]CAB3392767.1 stage V sporulation protein AD (uptake of pyridine-2,6-dicarboxylic acid) [Kyrpidia spormannii]
MARSVGSQTWQFDRVFLAGEAAAVGPKEGEGPLRDDFDGIFPTPHAGQPNWEKAEQTFLQYAFDQALEKAGKRKKDVGLFVAGDLMNQITTSTFVARSLAIPYLGVFSACATIGEALAVAALAVDSETETLVAAGTASHNATAERQYRYPTEYGAQKTDTAPCTVSGGGVALLARDSAGGPGRVRLTFATLGKVIDLGAKDPTDMAAAMVPAAADTLAAHFSDLNRRPSDYDLIVTGDLGFHGMPVLREWFGRYGYDLGDRYADCGALIYSPTQPEVFNGGSGSACCAVVTFGHLVRRLRRGELRRVLVAATGALHSTVSAQQGETIPTICHAVVLERED